MVLEAIGGCFPKGRQLGHAGGKFLLNQPKENCRNEKNRTKEMWKRHPKIHFLGRQSEAGLPRAGNRAKQVSLAGKAPSSFLAQINY